jgi:N-acetylneuraminate synthase
MMQDEFQIDGVNVGGKAPVYFIADIAANHDGSLERAKELIWLAKEAGADAAKFQHFQASKIVSDIGFKNLKDSESHQAKWKKSVTRVYEEASVPPEWTSELKRECDAAQISFLSTPYDFESVDLIDPFVTAFKIGSGDIDWLELIEYVATKRKPVILATGASTEEDVVRAVELLQFKNVATAILQCNTNYTASLDNFRHLNLHVLETFKKRWPAFVVGLSDHTRGVASVLASVTLGAKIIERHFTDDINREGPDHKFATDPAEWAVMVEETRRVELALGSYRKSIAENERMSSVVQRRCLRAGRDMARGTVLTRKDIDVLRPATNGAIKPSDLSKVIGATLTEDISCGEELRWSVINAES